MPKSAKKSESRKTQQSARTRQPANQRQSYTAAPSIPLAVLADAVDDPAAASPSSIRTLQRHYGNQAVTKLIQTKRAGGPADETYNREADHDESVDRVPRAPQLASLVQQRSTIQRQNGRTRSEETAWAGVKEVAVNAENSARRARAAAESALETTTTAKTIGPFLETATRAASSCDENLGTVARAEQEHTDIDTPRSQRVIAEVERFQAARASTHMALNVIRTIQVGLSKDTDGVKRAWKSTKYWRVRTGEAASRAEETFEAVDESQGRRGAADHADDTNINTRTLFEEARGYVSHIRQPGQKADEDDLYSGLEVTTGEGYDLLGIGADWLGTSSTTGQNVGANIDPSGSMQPGTGNALTGGDQAIVGGELGVGVNVATTILSVASAKENIETLNKTKQEHKRSKQDYRAGNEELFAAVSVLEKERSQAKKGLASDISNVTLGLNGILNGIVTIIAGAVQSGTAAAIASAGIGAVTFGVNYAGGAILSFIEAMRDFFKVHKRSKAKKQMWEMVRAYEQGLEAKHEEMANLKRTTISSMADIFEIEKTTQEITREILRLEKLRSAFAMAERKQGYGGNLASGGMNLLATAGGAALLASVISASTVAAATPIGWALAGAAALGILCFAIGKKIKKSLRNKNVTRMRQEREFVQEYIDTGKIAGRRSPAYDASGVQIHSPQENIHRDPAEREQDIWHRFMVQPEGVKVEKKGWFNRLFSKGKSGKSTMARRLNKLDRYLTKFDKEAAGDTIIEGLLAALDDSNPESQRMVKIDPKGPDDDSNKRTMKEQTRGLLEHFFPGKANDMIASLQSDNDKNREAAKRRILSKMKLT